MTDRDKTIEVMSEALCFVGKACDRHCPDVDHRPCPDALSTWQEDAEHILAHLQASGMAVVPGWQPIESAPKDGTVVDLWLGNDEDPHRRTDCYWGRPYHSCGEAGRYCDSCPPDHDMWCDPMTGGYEEELQPTHWMHTPASPYGKAVVKEGSAEDEARSTHTHPQEKET